LLADHGAPAFATVHAAALLVLDGHITHGGPSVADRAGVLAAESRARRLRQLQQGGPSDGSS
jgi:hypothetical protein